MFRSQPCQIEEAAAYSSKLRTRCHEERTQSSDENSDFKKKSNRAKRRAEIKIKGHGALETENYTGGLMSDC